MIRPMPVNREIPPPPLPHFHRAKSFIAFDVWLALIIGLILVIGTLWIMEKVIKSDRDHQQFMKQCIEFNHVDRCQELYRYDRRDLMNRRDK